MASAKTAMPAGQQAADADLWVLDLGNTRLKLARVRGTSVVEVHVYPRTRRAEALAFLRTQAAVGYALLSTGGDAAWWAEPLAGTAPVWEYRPGSPCPLAVNYATLETLGVDRLAAAVGAQALWPRTELLVVDAGTCITCEYVGAAGVYLGGSIAPGLRMRLRAMHAFTGKLPEVAPVWPDSLDVGVDTASAMRAGALGGAARELAARVSAFRQNHPRGRVVVTGGDGPFLRPHLPTGLTYRPALVLEGLAHLHAYAHAPR